MRDVYVVGVACTPFGKHPDTGIREMSSSVLELLAGDLGPAGHVSSQCESLWFGNCFMDAWGQGNLRGQMALVDYMEAGHLPRRLPVVNVEAACATSSVALHGAVKDVRSGDADVSIAMGVEKLVVPQQPDTRTPGALALLQRCTDHLSGDRITALYRQAADTIGVQMNFGDDRSLFMDTYALQARLHMAQFGTTVEQIAFGCAKNHNYGAQNELAQYRFAMTVDEALSDREVSFPLTRSMCAPIGDGAAAALVASGDWLRKQSAELQRRAVKVRATGASGGTYLRSSHEPTLSYEAAGRAYRQAGLSPSDIDVAEVHDATSFGEVLQVEMLGFCDRGDGGRFVAEGNTGPGGRVPVNTSGGLVSKGHPVGATGLSMVYELVLQLRGEAGDRQVDGARIGLAENGGGLIGLEEAICAVTILEGPGPRG